MKRTSYTLITGASLGIGRAFALDCARRGMNLFLVALPDKHLSAIKKEINDNFDINVHTLGIDLTRENASMEIYDYAISNNIGVNILINNAGLGTSGLFEESDAFYNTKLIKLNVQALVDLTHLFINPLKEKSPSYILNVSSLEAAIPSPYKAIYTGTKNFIHSFSLALGEELRESGIYVSVLCPGPVLTNKGGLERIKVHGRKGKLMVMMPDKVASIALKGMLNKKTVIIPGTFSKLVIWLSRYVPTPWKMRILGRLFRGYRYNKIEPEEEMVSSI